MPPDLSLESQFLGLIVAGVDEAGRGPLAGPVVAAAVILDYKHLPEGIDDSKVLKAPTRERLFTQIMLTARAAAIGMASVEEIDQINILQASLQAQKRAVQKLMLAPQLALIDGNRAPDGMKCKTQCVVEGDARCFSIAAASILAKVTRDRLMREMASQHPDYGFDRHFGYGTPQHLKALRSLGVTPHHRKTFAPVRAIIEAHRVTEAA